MNTKDRAQKNQLQALAQVNMQHVSLKEKIINMARHILKLHITIFNFFSMKGRSIWCNRIYFNSTSVYAFCKSSIFSLDTKSTYFS